MSGAASQAPEGQKYVVRIKRKAGVVTNIELFELVTVTRNGRFKLRPGGQSLAFNISIAVSAQSHKLSVHRISLDEEASVLFAWHDEKEVCSNMDEVCEWIAGQKIPPSIMQDVMTWCGSRV